MTRHHWACLAAVFCTVAMAMPARGEDPGYLLRYKLQAGEQLRYKVVHMATTKTRMGDTEEDSEMRTVSIKVWDITDASDSGEMTFDYGIESVQMTQQTGIGDEIRWDSTSDAIPPVQFSRVAERIGTTLGTIRMNGQAQILERSEEEVDSSSLGMGDVTMPLPADPVKIGGQWSVPREVRAKNQAGTLKVIKIREVYTLDQVQTGVATITVRSEALTPVEDQTVKSQLVQQLSNGTIRFDIDAGRVLSRQLDWDASVVGFQGPASNMEYRARLTEDLEADRPQAARLKGPLVR